MPDTMEEALQKQAENVGLLPADKAEEEVASEEKEEKEEVAETEEGETSETEETQEEVSEEKPQKRNRIEERFSKLTSSLKDYEHRQALTDAELARLRSENELLKDTRRSSTEKKGWNDLGEPELITIIQNESDEYSKSQVAHAIAQLTDLKAKSRFDELRGATELQQRQAISWQSATQELQESGIAASGPDFDASNPKSEVYKLANEIYQQNIRDEAFRRDPRNQARALSEAVARLSTRKLLEARGQVKGLKKKADKKVKSSALESGGRAAVPPQRRKSLEEFVSGKRSLESVLGERIAVPE